MVAHAALASTVLLLIIHVACSVFLRVSLSRALVVGSLSARSDLRPLRISAVHACCIPADNAGILIPYVFWQKPRSAGQTTSMHIRLAAVCARALFTAMIYAEIARIFCRFFSLSAARQSVSRCLTPCDHALFGTYVVLEEPCVSTICRQAIMEMSQKFPAVYLFAT